MCKPKETGGLGIKDWDLFNIALLGKWRWKLRSGGTDLCSRVLWARYGHRAMHIKLDVRPGDSRWWKDVFQVCYEPDEEGCWFDGVIRRNLGCGDSTLFWKDSWCGDSHIKNQFPKLFHLSTQKNSNIKEMGDWANGKRCWSFTWRRNLSSRERNLLEELCLQLDRAPLVESVPDGWVWTAESNGVFSVQSAYRELQGSGSEIVDSIYQQIWNSKAPSNVCGFIWRVMLERIATKVNLLRRKVIHSDSEALCPLCSQELETADHVLLVCPFANRVWTSCYRWLGLSIAQPKNCKDHLLQHSLIGFNAKQNELFKVIWFAVTWSLWLTRNQFIFRGGNLNEESVLEGAIVKAWQWANGRSKGFNFSVYEWTSQPILCLRMAA